MDWNGAAFTLRPPLWGGLETGGKAGGREDGAGGCSEDRDIEAWGRTRGWGRGKDGRTDDGMEGGRKERRIEEMARGNRHGKHQQHSDS